MYSGSEIIEPGGYAIGTGMGVESGRTVESWRRRVGSPLSDDATAALLLFGLRVQFRLDLSNNQVKHAIDVLARPGGCLDE